MGVTYNTYSFYSNTCQTLHKLATNMIHTPRMSQLMLSLTTTDISPLDHRNLLWYFFQFTLATLLYTRYFYEEFSENLLSLYFLIFYDTYITIKLYSTNRTYCDLSHHHSRNFPEISFGFQDFGTFMERTLENFSY